MTKNLYALLNYGRIIETFSDEEKTKNALKDFETNNLVQGISYDDLTIVNLKNTIGDNVRFRASDNAASHDFGKITSFNDSFIFVDFGRKRGIGIATRPTDLILEKYGFKTIQTT